MSDKIRVAIVVSHPVQHFIHLYRALAKEPAISLLVIYASDIGARRYFDREMGVEILWEIDLFSGYDYKVLPESPRIKETGFWTINNPSIVKALDEFRPQVVQLHGYAQMTLLRALTWCKMKRVPVLLWSDSSLLFQRGLLKRMAKTTLINLLMRLFDGVLTTGDNNEAYYLHYGVPRQKLFRCPFTVDEPLFATARESRRDVRNEWRKRYGIPEDTFLILFVGKLISKKRPKDILDALMLGRVRDGTSPDVTAFFAGNGALKEELQSHAASSGLNAVFGGFVNVDILPYIYAMADVLVFPSDREPYGLSAREAICVGLPLIVSDQIGCVGPSDAARPKENAIIYPAGDVHVLSEAVALMSKNAEILKRMGDASLRIARELNVDASVNGFLGAVRRSSRER